MTGHASGGRPRLLFLSQTLPFPPDGGVKIRTYNILKILASAYDVTALCFYRRQKSRKKVDTASLLGGLSEFGRIEAFEIPQEHDRTRLVLDHARSVLTGRSYTVASYDSRAFRERLDHVLATEQFDLVHADSLDLSGYFPRLGGLPLACTHHDVQSSLLARRAEQERTAFRRRYVAHQSRLMLAEERRWCPRVGLNVAVSDVDRNLLELIAPDGNYTVVPNGVDIDEFRPLQQETAGLVFVGGAGWFPNLDAMEFFAREIFPRIRARSPKTTATWAGRSSDSQREAFGARGITVTGYLPDIRPTVQRAACYVVPIRVGGGTRIKILDAWAMGKAVVSTSVGCEGLAARDGENILIRDEPDSFAAAVLDVLEQPRLRESLGRAARATAEKTYSWEVIGRGLLASYAELRASAPPVPAGRSGFPD